jgi:NAD(P)-dependent dehydrogenase (short-subunit alcohol dehydrogenase family)
VSASIFSLKGKREVVTGGLRGIGDARSDLLADCGADVCVGYRSRMVEADAMVCQITAKCVRAVAHSALLAARTA